LRAFCQQSKIDSVVLVVLADLIEVFRTGIQQHLAQYADKLSLVAGGATRQSSVLSGLEFLAKQKTIPKYVLIHDAVRPFVSQEEIDSIITELKDGLACTLALPVTDSIKSVKDKLVTQTLNRHTLVLMQTPQAAGFDTLLAAHQRLKEDGIETTDDAAVLEHARVPVKIVLGSALNFKITSQEDFWVAQAIAPQLRAKAQPVKV